MRTFAPQPSPTRFTRVFRDSAVHISLALIGFGLTAQTFALDHSHAFTKGAAAIFDAALFGCVLALIVTPIRMRLFADRDAPASTGVSLKSALVATAIGVAVALVLAFDHMGGRFQ